MSTRSKPVGRHTEGIVYPKIRLAIRSAASSWSAGTACEYVSMVMLTDECPSHSLTTFGCTPALSAKDAYVWRRSCRRTPPA